MDIEARSICIEKVQHYLPHEAELNFLTVSRRLNRNGVSVFTFAIFSIHMGSVIDNITSDVAVLIEEPLSTRGFLITQRSPAQVTEAFQRVLNGRGGKGPYNLSFDTLDG